MKESKFNIKDESQDRKYFSIVPHFVTNHSTLAERGFYLTLKRITGEYGTVRYSARDLGKMCGISDDTAYRLLDSLIKRGWIKEAGKIPTGHKPRRTYSIVDLWKQNIDFYTKKTVNRPGAVNEDNVAPERDIKPQTKGTEEESVKEELSNTSETLPNGKSRQIEKANERDHFRCPLLLKEKYPSLVEKYPGGHKECVEFIAAVEEEKGHKFINLPKQFGIVHRILRAGFDFNDMDKALNEIQKSSFYQDKGWDFATVAQWLERK